MFLVLEGNGQDQEAAQALLQEHGYAVSMQSNPLSVASGLPQRIEKHAHCICDNGHLGIFRSSFDDQLLSINPAGARMFKYGSPQEMIEAVNRTGILDALYVDSSDRVEIQAATLSSEDWHVCEVQFYCKDRSVMDCNFHIRAVRDADDRPVELEGFYEDISQRKKTERALQRTQITVDKTSDQVFWMDARGHFLYVNEEACVSLGYTREELLTMSVFDIDPGFAETDHGEIWRYIQINDTLTHERQHQAKDGRTYPVEIRCNYVNFDGQEFSYAFATDITERKQRDEALRLSQFVVDKTSDQAFWITPEGRFFYVNEAGCAALGYSRAELESLAVWDIDPHCSQENAAAYWRLVKENGSMRSETLHRTKDGRIYPVEIRCNYVNFDGMEYSCAFATDISERKQMEQQLRQASLIVENSPVVLFRWKAQPGWPVEVVTKNVIRFGYTPEELISGAVPFSSLVHPGDLERVAAEVQAYTSNGVEHFQQEYRIITREGDVRWIEDCTFIERDAQGEATHYQGIVIDITERKRNERIMMVRMRLLQFAATHTLDELLEATLDEMEELTGSQSGIFHFLEADQETLSLKAWSTRSKQEFCTAQEKDLHYPVSQAGAWADCIYERRPIIHNDYLSHPHRKGLPSVHASVIRELAVPVIRGENIVAIVAVGNKVQGYTHQDVEMVSLLADFAWEIVERKEAEELTQASLAEKEVLLREIHHRVKNNLQVVSSLLYLQSQKFNDPGLQACLLESQSRICSMALAHEQLYQSKNLAEVSVKTYVESLVGQLKQTFQSLDQEVDCRLAVDDLPLDIEKMVPCGLLITELLSNAYKHAFKDGQKGQVTISLQSSAGQIELSVADNGVGFPADLDYRQAKTLGLQLVSALANQLGGSLNLESDAGTCFQVCFTE